MLLKCNSVAITMLIIVVGGCATPPPPPTQVQVNFNFTSQNQSTLPKHIARGAMSGMPQRVNFYYSVNPDCSSDGLVQTRLTSSPTHGSVAFAKADGYTSFPPSSPSHECNSKKSPGIEVVYTSAKDFVGTDQFTVQGLGPHGKYMETDYTIKVLAP